MKTRRQTHKSVLLVLFSLTLLFLSSPAHAQDTTRMKNLINRWVERVEMRVDRLLNRYCQRFTNYQEQFGSDLPEFCADNTPAPSPSPSIIPTPSPSVTPSPSPSVSPSPSPSTSPSASPSVSPSPSPSPQPATTLLLSEVYYDVDATHGTENANEWIEIYNDSDSEVDLSGFIVADAAGNDTLPAGTTIPANGYLVITNDLSTTTFWSIPSTTVTLGSLVGNGLGNTGDSLLLKDPNGAVLDAVSWGNNVTAFDPSAALGAVGSSITRSPVTTDTNTASDWIELAAPTPGS